MAIDTAAKRRLWVFPIPDGTIAASDRAHLGIGYAGITMQEPTEAEMYMMLDLESGSARPILLIPLS